ncbi:uncharacterized protein LOC125226843 isoform X2 [Leguminivora glycinivorella]|uniref:uncharacterized protein LOC125226843 isoform X2 n=1 Tax=Leguminivora glycinivorella TaxID=1035111 RepID=UPI0020103ED6|nr:uncharacterized protein LOC125226843 isoform X2 [Leguminivora glycinivorella]
MPGRICKNLRRGPSVKLLFTIEDNFENLRNTKTAIGIMSGEDELLHDCTVDNIVDVCLSFDHWTLEKFNPGEEKIVNINIYVKIAAKTNKQAKHNTIILKATCNELNYSKQITCTEHWLENILIGYKKVILKKEQFTVSTDLEINLSVIQKEPVTFAKLYDDTILTDFQLSTAEGSVAVHKVCLAAHSDIFKTMFNGPWKDVSNGPVGSAVTLSSLQHFKEYVYLGKLPDEKENLQHLLLLSLLYSMEALKSERISKLIELVNSENLYSLFEFACKNNIPDLTFAMLLQVPDEVVHETYELRKPIDKDTTTQDEK